MRSMQSKDWSVPEDRAYKLRNPGTQLSRPAVNISKQTLAFFLIMGCSRVLRNEQIISKTRMKIHLEVFGSA